VHRGGALGQREADGRALRRLEALGPLVLDHQPVERDAWSAASVRPRSSSRSATRTSWMSTILAHLVAAQPTEDQHVVQAVQELRPEGAADSLEA